MTISERIDSEIIAAMKAREKDKLTYLRNFKSALKYKEIDKHAKLTEAEEIEVLSSAVKKLRDAIELTRQGGREDLALKSQAELDLALTYMPAQMGEQEIEQLAREVLTGIEAAGPQAVGMVMKGLMPKVKGKADGMLVKASYNDY